VLLVRPREFLFQEKEVLMGWQRSLLLACLAAGLVGYSASAADEKSNKEKILGTWELVKADSPDAGPPGTLVEFMKDGKLKVTATIGDKKIVVNGSYSLDGDTLKTKVTTPDGQESSDTDTIVKLTDKEMSLKNTKGNKTEFKKK
jgi:uncharacterized protein (TIGR03066 family)